jgi:hypothetical protein
MDDLSGSSDSSKVSDECIPVFEERVFGRVVRLELTECPFVNDSGIAGKVEHAWCDPRLRDEGRNTIRLWT